MLEGAFISLYTPLLQYQKEFNPIARSNNTHKTAQWVIREFLYLRKALAVF